MAKTKKEAGTEDNPTAAQETATRPEETEEKGDQESGTDAEGHEDSGLDKGDETPATGGEGLSDSEKAFLRELVASAKKVFASHDLERLYFTADGMGFGNETDASNHATTLESHAILTVDRKDLLN